ncbi:MAG: type II CAAX endopeptidase family protein [Gemmataceae bacterium]
MSDSPQPAPRGHPLIAWGVLLLLLGYLVWPRPETPGHRRDSPSQIVPLQLQGRYLVGVASLRLPGVPAEKLFADAAMLIDQASYPQRLRYAILGGELVGMDQAKEALASLEAERQAGDIEASAEDVAAVERLQRWYRDDDLPDSDRAALRKHLGWFGSLALAPEGSDPAERQQVLGPARRTLIGYAVFLTGGVLALGTGSFLILLGGSMAFLGRLHPGLVVPSGHGGIYAETFTAYMVLYFGLTFGIRYLPVEKPALWVNGLAMMLALLALAWPVLRGIPWTTVRQDLGLHSGQGLGRELLAGIATYLAAIPLLVVGVAIMFLLMYLSGRSRLGLTSGAPTHPIIGLALQAGWWMWLQVFVVAAVLAPVVEEAMFRGALYRHLRDATGAWRPWISVAVAALASSVLFAAIHPQGWLAVPALTMLALVFALAREWRQSLVPAMVAHAINNGLMTLMLLLLAG